MDYNQAWLQHAGTDLQVAQHGQQAVSDDWKDDLLASFAAGGGSSPPPLDLNDFNLEALGTASSSAGTSSTTPYYPLSTFYQQLNSPGPFNAVSYGSQSWPTGPTNPLPISPYSSLQGANSEASSSQTSSQRVPSAQSSAMMIDPALTHMNVTNLNPSSQSPVQYSQDHSAYQYPHPQQPSQYQYQHQSHPPTLSINPSYVQSNGSHYQASPPLPRSTLQQQQQQHQGTLSPFVLHSPPNIVHSPIATSSFYGIAPQAQPPQPPQSTINPLQAQKTPEQRRVELLAEIRPFLAPTSFTGAGAVQQLMYRLPKHDEEVDPSTRLEILTKMRDNAGNHYFRAWVENDEAMHVTRSWLLEAYQGKDDLQLVETIMPLLHVIDRLPLTLESLKSSKLGKLIVKLAKEPPTPAIKDMASNLERKWRQLLPPTADGAKGGDNDGPEDSKSKKRKAEASKAAPPAKKAAVVPAAGPSKTTVVKKEPGKAAPQIKDAKSDSSFFSAPKPKPKLPSFKKAPVPLVKKEPDLNVAQPSSINPFEEALKSMAKVKRESPATATPPPAPPASVPPAPALLGLAANGKPKKRVSWAPEGKLEIVKFIERAIYDGDPVDGVHSTHNIRDLDRDEGAALHTHIFEEQIDWSEPLLIVIPPDLDIPERGWDSQEKGAQEEREKSALVALYMSPAHIPDSPVEPPSQIPEEQVDENVRMMLTGADVDAVFWSGGAPVTVEQPQVPSVAELVGQLSGSGDAPMVDVFPAAPLSAIEPNKIQEMLQSLAAVGQPAPPAGPEQSWGQPNQQHPDFDERGGYYDDSRDRRWSEDGYNDRGRGRSRGRGRGRGDGYRNNKRKPCSFFAAGRCRYGDQCDFSHEPIY